VKLENKYKIEIIQITHKYSLQYISQKSFYLVGTSNKQRIDKLYASVCYKRIYFDI